MLTDLDPLHSSIVARLSADLSGVYVDDYPALVRRITLPAVLVELEELEPDDFGTDGFDAYARFTAYCIYDPNQTNAYLQVRNLAATVAVRIRQEEDFSNDGVVMPAEILRIGEDSFNPDLDGYMVWAVEFQLGVTLGELEWAANPADGVSVATISVGDLNSVGADHSMTTGTDEPEAVDNVDLPDTPKG